jgi:hypothetical protein
VVSHAARIRSATFCSCLSVYFRGGGQISPKPSFRQRGTTCKCKWNTVCSATRPADVIRFIPSGLSDASIAWPTRSTAIISSAAKVGSAFHKSAMCSRGITSVCPGVAGSSGKKATQSLPSQTISTERSLPRAIAQKSQFFDSAPVCGITSLLISRPSRSNRRGCDIRRRYSTDKNRIPQESGRTFASCCRLGL